MTYDIKLANLFYANFKEADRSANLLLSSYQRLKNLFPIKSNALDKLTEEEKDKLDAFRVRFCDLQDVIGNKIFRSILLLEEEELGSQLDIFNKIAKRNRSFNNCCE